MFSFYWQKQLRNNHLNVFWLPALTFLIVGTMYFQANMGGTGTDLPINLLGWGFFSISLAIGLWRLSRTSKIVTSQRLNFIGLIILLLYLPFIYGKSQPQASTWYQFLALPMLWLYLLFSMQFIVTERTRKLLISGICIATSAHMLLGLAQAFFMEANTKPFGHFQQFNLMGSYLMTGYAGLFYLLNNNLLNKNRSPLLLIAAFTLISFGTGWLTAELGSRGTLLAGAIVSVLCILQVLASKNWKHALVILGFIVGCLLGFSSDKNSAKETNTITHYQTYSEREVLYPQVFELLEKNLITGVGYGNFEAAYTLLGAENAAATGNPKWVQHNMSHPHNELLFWFAEGGVIAGGAATVFFIAMIFWLIPFVRNRHYTIVALFVPIALHSLTEYPLQTSFTHLLLLLILLRLFILEPRLNLQAIKYLKVPEQVQPMFRPIALFVVLGGISFSLTGLHTVHLVLKYEMAYVKTPAPYLKIVNPFVHYDRYWTNIMAHKAMAGVHNSDHKAVQEYIDWAEKTIQHHPREVYLENIVKLKNYLGTLEKADCEKYEFYFPDKQCAFLLKQ